MRRGSKMSEKSIQKMRNAKLKSNNPNWRGGRTVVRGYVQVLVPDHPYCNTLGYVLEHRLVMEKCLGRYLKPYEIVHHKNGIRDDNRPENLELYINHPKHMSSHYDSGFSLDSEGNLIYKEPKYDCKGRRRIKQQSVDNWGMPGGTGGEYR